MVQLVGELNIMPLLVLSCKMCPKNIEATMYAFLMSTMNMGIYMYFYNEKRKHGKCYFRFILFVYSRR